VVIVKSVDIGLEEPRGAQHRADRGRHRFSSATRELHFEIIGVAPSLLAVIDAEIRDAA